MKAQLMNRIDKIENHPLAYTDVEDPKPLEDEVLIKIKACGVCYSNLSMIEGEFKAPFGIPTKLPIIPGHEITGVIEESGSQIQGLQRGDPVGVQVLWKTDGTCEFCQTGRENLCLNKQTTGETVDGGFAEYIKAPGSFVYRLPENLDLYESAPLFCPGVTAYRAVKRAQVVIGQRVAIIGIGGVGHMTVQFAKLAGAEVIAIDKDESKLELAQDVGADRGFTADDMEDEVHENGKFDAVFVHAPSQKAVEQALRIVKRGGIVLMGIVGDAHVIFPDEYSVIGSVIGTRHDMQQVLKIAARGKLKVDCACYKLNEAEDVLMRLKQGKIVGRAVLVP